MKTIRFDLHTYKFPLIARTLDKNFIDICTQFATPTYF